MADFKMVEKLQTPFSIYEIHNIEVRWCSFRFGRKQLEIQDCWLKVTDCHIYIFEYYDDNHIEWAILDFEILISELKRAP